MMIMTTITMMITKRTIRYIVEQRLSVVELGVLQGVALLQARKLSQARVQPVTVQPTERDRLRRIASHLLQLFQKTVQLQQCMYKFSFLINWAVGGT